MKLANLIALMLVMVAAFINSVQACKCTHPSGGDNDYFKTKRCCNEVGGNFRDNDCDRSSMESSLSGFKACCKTWGFNSDCGY